MPIGYFDPDYDDENQAKRHAWQIPKTDLLKKAMSASGRKYFKKKKEQRRWRFLEERTLGATETHIMFRAWIQHNIELNISANAQSVTRSFAGLMTMIENKEREIDWTIANKEEVMRNRMQSIKSIMGTGAVKHGRSNSAE